MPSCDGILSGTCQKVCKLCINPYISIVNPLRTDIHTYMQAQPQTKAPLAPATPARLSGHSSPVTYSVCFGARKICKLATCDDFLSALPEQSDWCVMPIHLNNYMYVLVYQWMCPDTIIWWGCRPLIKNLVSGDETMSVTSTGIAVCKGIFCCLWKLLGEAWASPTLLCSIAIFYILYIYLSYVVPYILDAVISQ